MGEVVYLRREVLEHFECAICLDKPEEIKICPQCSWIFCDKCIITWLTNNQNCPRCLNILSYPALVKGCLLNQIQESIQKLFSSMDDQLCDKHATKQLSLFCYSCEVTICVQCLYLEEHNEHKERVVLLEEAFVHYKRSLEVALTWIGERKEVIERIQSELSEEKNEIEVLCQNSEELLGGNANEFMSEPTILVFRMPLFDSVIKEQGLYETSLQAPHRFEWKCKIANEDGALFCYLCLIAGKAGDYSVLFGNALEKVDRYELNKYMKIGVYQPVLSGENYLQELTVQIRQSYADRIQQQQDYIDRLEKENAKYVALKTFLADLDKKNAGDIDVQLSTNVGKRVQDAQTDTADHLLDNSIPVAKTEQTHNEDMEHEHDDNSDDDDDVEEEEEEQ